MLKTLTQLTAAAGVLMSLPGIAKMTSATPHDNTKGALSSQDAAKVMTLLGGGTGDINMSNATSILTGIGEMGASQEKQPVRPKGPMTLIRMSADTEEQEAKAEELPPDANVIAVDGRVQVYRPAGKPSHHR